MPKHIVALEEKIYENPADDAPSLVLWSVFRKSLQVERLLTSHLQLLEMIQDRLTFLITLDRQPPQDWLRQNTEDFSRLGISLEEDLKKPAPSITDPMYKSVNIRGARQSYELSTSLWRLS